MKRSEAFHILSAIFIMGLVISFRKVFEGNTQFILTGFLFAAIIVLVTVIAKKLMALTLESGVEHRIWSSGRFWIAKQSHLKKEAPLGILIPLTLSLFSLGIIKFMPVLTYETTAHKSRSGRAFGALSFASMTDWHNALIGGAGIIAVLLVSFISYFLPLDVEFLAAMAAFYAFANMIPYGNLDGMQIYMGSRVLWTTLAAITLILSAYAVVIV